MKSMPKFIRTFTFILAAVPTVLFAQNEPQHPCPENIKGQVEITVASLESLKSLENLQELKVLSHLHKLSNLSELHHLSSVADMLENQDHQPNPEVTFDVEKRKTFDKTYKVGKSDVLAIENKFGKVHVNTWDKNEIRVKVDVIARANSESRAQDILEKIDIEDSKSGNRISVKTEMESMNISGNSNKGFEINYIIYMPDDNELAIKNSFGDVYLPDFKGRTDLNIKYGSLKAQRMSNASNKLKLAYSNGNCSFMNKGDVDIAYSDFDLGNVNTVLGSSKFSEFRIDNLNEVLDLDVKYGVLRVDNISKNVERIDVDSGFTPVTLRFEDNSAFNFDVNVQFGDFNVNKNLVNITSQEKGHTSAEYKGKYGSTTSKGSVNINSKYGDVKFTN